MAPAEERAAISIAWSKLDELRIVTVIGIVGLAAALTMAVFGLPPVDLQGPSTAWASWTRCAE